MATYTARIGSQYQLVLTVNTQSQSQANNTSTLSYSLRVDKLSGYGYWTDIGQSYSVRINGQTVRSGNWTYNFNNYSSYTITSGTTTVKHNDSGTLTVSLSVSVSMYSIGTGSTSSTYTPAKINRGVEGFTFNFGWTNVDGNKNITFSKPVSSIRSQLEWKYYNEKGGGWSNTRTVSTNYTSGNYFSFSTSDINLLHSQNPNSKTVYIEVTLKSYQSNILTKTVTRGVTLNLKAEPPEINSTFKINGKGQELFNNPNYAVQDVHWLKITDNVTAKNGATITKITVTFEGRSQSAKNAEFKITKTGTSAISVKATDSRGYSFTKTIGTIYVRAYTPPSLNGYKSTRLERNIENSLGSTGAVLGTIKYQNVLNSRGYNINSPWWKISFQNTTVTSLSIRATKEIAIEDTEDFTLTFGDSFTTLTIYGTIPAGQAALVLGKKGIGVNAIPPQNASGIHIGGKYDYERSINFYNGQIKQVLRTATGYSIGNGVGFMLDFGTDTNLLFLNDGSIWVTDRNGKTTKKIAG